jgi:hypothetical protein
MDEIHLWRWRFTDENGKRRESSWRMTEATVRHFPHVYGNAEKIQDTLEVRKPLGSTADWQRSPHAVRVGRCFESSWQLLKHRVFKGLTDEAAWASLDAWCRRQRFEAEFQLRKVRDENVFFVILSAHSK